MTLDSVRSNEEFEDEGISTVKTVSKLKPNLVNYNSGSNSPTKVERHSTMSERYSTLHERFNSNSKRNNQMRASSAYKC